MKAENIRAFILILFKLGNFPNLKQLYHVMLQVLNLLTGGWGSLRRTQTEYKTSLTLDDQSPDASGPISFKFINISKVHLLVDVLVEA